MKLQEAFYELILENFPDKLWQEYMKEFTENLGEFTLRITSGISVIHFKKTGGGGTSNVEGTSGK